MHSFSPFSSHQNLRPIVTSVASSFDYGGGSYKNFIKMTNLHSHSKDHVWWWLLSIDNLMGFRITMETHICMYLWGIARLHLLRRINHLQHGQNHLIGLNAGRLTKRMKGRWATLRKSWYFLVNASRWPCSDGKNSKL